MAKAADRRVEITGRMADYLLAHGLQAATLRPLAAAVGTTDRMLLYYFPTKDAALAAALECVAYRLQAALGPPAEPRLPPDALEAELLAAVASPALWPFMAVWLEVAALAARGDPLCRTVGAAIAAGFHQWIAARLEAPGPDHAAAAMRVLRTVEGAVVLRSVGA